MNFKRVLTPPGRSVWWFAGAALVGFVLPAILSAVVMLAGWYPIGSALPRSIFWTEFGPVLMIDGCAAVILVAAPVYSLLAWSWRPLLLALVVGCSGFLGIVPGMIGGKQVQDWAFDLFSCRSSNVVEAISNYARVTGAPPATLAKLVPDYLPSIPTTGMAQAPEYTYKAAPGPCSLKNKWHLSVSVQDFLSVHRLLYCPQQDYAVREEVGSKTMFGAWRRELIDF